MALIEFDESGWPTDGTAALGGVIILIIVGIIIAIVYAVQKKKKHSKGDAPSKNSKKSHFYPY